MSSREELYDQANSARATRCGATKDPHQRKYGYTRSSVGMYGTMYCLQVNNQYKEENELLSIKYWKKNKHKISNVDSKPGYIYVIVENNN